MNEFVKDDRKINRREFVNQTGTLLTLSMAGVNSISNSKYFHNKVIRSPKIRIKNVNSNFEREPLFPYHFKGSAITQCWQTAALLEADSGSKVIGLGTQGNFMVRFKCIFCAFRKWWKCIDVCNE